MEKQQILVDTGQAAMALSGVKGQLGGLRQVLTGVGTAWEQAFSAGETQLKKTQQAATSLTGQLFVWKMQLGRLKAELGRALEPVLEAVLPTAIQAVRGLTGLTQQLGQVTRALFGGAEGADAFAQAEKSVTVSVQKAKRALAGFDEIQRLDASGGSVRTETVKQPAVTDTLTPQVKAVVDKIRSLAEPLKQIDLSAVTEAFRRLREAVAPITRELFEALEWAWHNLLVPLARWTAENALPVFLEVLRAGLEAFHSVLTALRPMADWLWKQFLEPIARWSGGIILEVLQALQEKLTAFGNWVGSHQGAVEALVVAIGSFGAAWAVVNGALESFNALGRISSGVTGGIGSAFGQLLSPIGLVTGMLGGLLTAVVLVAKNWDVLRTGAQSAWRGVCEVFSNVRTWWEDHVTNPLTAGIRLGVNELIHIINSLLSGLGNGLNGIVQAVNALHFRIPDWIPGLGGKEFGFHLGQVSLPQIPYLAQGAVLPANKPFLAMVGDQTHGTNVEAPLATIQEAVAAVMADYADSNLAGHEATVSVLREILAAVLGIEIGDDVIGSASLRYRQKYAVMGGGIL